MGASCCHPQCGCYGGLLLSSSVWVLHLLSSSVWVLWGPLVILSVGVTLVVILSVDVMGASCHPQCGYYTCCHPHCGCYGGLSQSSSVWVLWGPLVVILGVNVLLQGWGLTLILAVDATRVSDNHAASLRFQALNWLISLTGRVAVIHLLTTYFLCVQKCCAEVRLWLPPVLVRDSTRHQGKFYLRYSCEIQKQEVERFKAHPSFRVWFKDRLTKLQRNRVTNCIFFSGCVFEKY